MCSLSRLVCPHTATIAALITLLAAEANAATVSVVGSIADNTGGEVTQWRTGSTAKSFDLDGNNIYGSAGYSIFRGNQGGGTAAVWNTAITEQQASGLSLMQAGAIDATIPLQVGDSNLAVDWDDPTNPAGTRNMGYAGPRENSPVANGAVPLSQAFTYSVTQNISDTLRMGVVADGLGDSRIPLANLRVVVGGSQADATVAANPANSLPDMYFFDLDGLQSGDTIEIFMEGLIGAATTFSWPTISGVTFDAEVAAPPPFLGVRVNRQTGAMTLDAENLSASQNIIAYSISSAIGALDPGQWTPISGNYDKVGNGGNGLIDSDDAWTRLTSSASRGDLSEAEFDAIDGAGNGAVLGSTNQSIDLGTPWIQNPTADLVAVLKLADGSNLNVPVEYTGDPIAVGDLNFDGVITAADWPAYRDGFGADMSALSAAESYQLGDLDGDGDNDEIDFGIFKTMFESQGNGSLSALTGVPEPSSALLLIAAAVAFSAAPRLLTRRQRQLQHSIAVHPSRVSSMTVPRQFKAPIAMALITGLATLIVARTEAATVSSMGAITENANNQVTQWRTDTTVKTLDLAPPGQSADNVYGTLGYSVFRGNQGSGAAAPWNTGITEQQVLGLSLIQPGSLDGDSTLALRVGDSSTAANWDDPANPGGVRNMGYAGPRREAVMGNPAPAVQLVQAYTYQATLDFEGPIRIGIAANGLTDARVLLSQLQVKVGGSMASATLAPAPATPNVPSMYFFDVSGLHAGDLIEIGMAGNLGTLGNPFSWPTINGVTFDGPGVRPLTLKVNTVTGQVNLLNTSLLNGFEVDLLKITSGSESLSPEGWSSLANQDFEGNGPPSGTGDGWEELGTPNAGELAEAFLLGNSPIGPSSSIDLGIAYNTTVGGEDLSFLFRLTNGSIVTGLVEYDDTVPSGVAGDYNGNGIVDAADYTVWRDSLGGGGLPNEGGISPGVVDAADYAFWKSRFGATSASGGFSAAAVPEPPSMWLVLGGLAAVVGASCCRKLVLCTATVIPCVAAVVAWVVVGSVSLAAVTNDREYWFGEDGLEGTSQNGIIGSNNTPPLSAGNSADSKGPDTGTFLDLTVASGEPRYADVGPGGLQRPGVAVQQFGARFDGVDDALTGIALARPDDLQNRTGGAYPLNYTGITSRGVQMWVYPDTAKVGAAHQSILVDSPVMGGPQISADGNWTQVNGNHSSDDADGGIPGGVPVVGNTWHHVMHHVYNQNDPGSPRRVTGSAGTNHEAVLYVNGVAVSANFDNIPTVTTASLFVGAQADGAGGSKNHFMGVIDDVEMYVFGDNTSQGGQNWGQFDLFSDNEWIRNEILNDSVLNGILLDGDVNKDGVVNNSDVDAFVLGWLSENQFVGAHGTLTAGDWHTWDRGDMNHDGITDLDDAFILHQALLTSGSGGLDFGLLTGATVPEPSTVAISMLSMAGVLAKARRKTGV